MHTTVGWAVVGTAERVRAEHGGSTVRVREREHAGERVRVVRAGGDDRWADAVIALAVMCRHEDRGSAGRNALCAMS
jgi:hypothetical protein